MKSLLITYVFIGLMCTHLLGADHKGKGSLSLYNITTGSGMKVSGNLEYKWRLWTLVGEPVDMLVARWNIQSVDFTLASEEFRDKLRNPITGKYQSEYEVCGEIKPIGCIPKHIMEKVGIVELKLLGIRSSSGPLSKRDLYLSYSYLFDAGVMSKPYAQPFGIFADNYGKWSYNTPGSKNWDKCFEHSTEEESKKIMKSDVYFNEFRIQTIKFNFSEVKRYLIKRNKELEKELEKEKKKELEKENREELESEQESLDYDYEKFRRYPLTSGYKEEDLQLKQQAIDDKIRIINDKIRKSTEDIEKKYASVEIKLNNEAKEKESILQLTKNQVAKRVKPVKKTDDEYHWLDKKTRLTWHMNKKNPRMGWTEAKNYCQGLNALGNSNWHLPSTADLLDLFERRANLTIANKKYTGQNYWTSTNGVVVAVLTGRRLGSPPELYTGYDKSSRNPKSLAICISKNVDEKPNQ